MGRKKLYKTEAEKKQANRLKARRYYLKNAKKIREKRMEKYYEEKQKHG